MTCQDSIYFEGEGEGEGEGEHEMIDCNLPFDIEHHIPVSRKP